MPAPRPLRHLGFAIVRTPVLPMAQWLTHAAQGKGGDGWQCRADSAQRLFRRPLVAEAICIASPGLHARLKHWHWRLRDADDRKTLAAFERYLNRMCFRATPFGLFSTVSYAPLLPGQPWTLDEAAAGAAPERVARPDGEALFALCGQVQDGAPATATRYTVNASLYRVGTGYRYMDWTSTGSTGRNYQLGEIDGHPVIDELVERMGDRLLDCGSIAALLDDIGRREDVDVAALVDDLVAAKVLLPAVSVDPLNADPPGALAAALVRHPAHAAAGEELSRLNAMLRAVPPDHALEHYQHADRRIRELTGAAPAGLAIQVDAFRKHAGMAVDAGEVEAAIGALDWLMDRFSVRHGPLDSFCDSFTRRYGSGTVPLMEVLDPEAGIGFGQAAVSNKLLAALGIKRPPVPSAQVTLTPLDHLLLSMLQRDPGLMAAPEVTITRADAAGLALAREGSDGNGMTAVLNFPVLRTAERTAVLAGLDHEGTLNWLTRFCHGDERIAAAARAHARQVESESGAEIVHAEIAYLPQARAVNVLSRPPLWTWRVNLAEAAAEPGAHDLPVSDLMLSVRGKEVYLWSRRLRKRVIPHRTSAHRIEDGFNTAPYRFLCTLCSHGMRLPRLDWGEVFASLDYRPRLRFESLVLAPARWRIRAEALAQLQDGPQALRTLLAERRLPQRVELAEGDNRLLLDLDDEVDIEQLTRMAKKGRELLLVEVLDDLGDATHASDSAPAYRHQVVVPLHRTAPAAPAAAAFGRDLVQVPMDEALYVKLYGGQETLDGRVLPQVAAWVAHQRQQDAIGNWFFIRYAERGWHLRLRVFPRAGQDGPVLHSLVQLAEDLYQRGWIARFEFSPYERETLRYGGRAHVAANEALFGIDSDLAAAILCGQPFGPGAEPARWSVALLAIDALLRDYGLSLADRLALATRLAAGFRAEFGLPNRQLASLGDWYRRHGREMVAALRCDQRAPAWSVSLWRLLDSVSARRRALAGPLRAADPQLEMAASQVHMLCNRLFMAQNREFEVLVYDFLARAYRTLVSMPAAEEE
jgi:lantibiotic biosynthesis protein